MWLACCARAAFLKYTNNTLNTNSSAPTTLNTEALHERWYRVQYSGHLAWVHRGVGERTDLRALAESLQPDRHLPAFGLVDEEDVLLAVAIADAGAEEVETFADLLASLFSGLAQFIWDQRCK